MPSYLITGTSRGLGLGFATELLKDSNNTVIATARYPDKSKGLQDLIAQNGDNGRLHLLQLDVADKDSVEKAVAETAKLLPNGLDNLVSNAGIAGDPFATWSDLIPELLRDEVGTSVYTHFNAIKGFLPLVRKSHDKKILVVSSSLGSMELSAAMPICIGYSIARAALNMLARKWSEELKKDGITIAIVHPGLVATDMGGQIVDFVRKAGGDDISLEQSSYMTMRVLKRLNTADNGQFLNFDGTTIPW